MIYQLIHDISSVNAIKDMIKNIESIIRTINVHIIKTHLHKNQMIRQKKYQVDTPTKN